MTLGIASDLSGPFIYLRKLRDLSPFPKGAALLILSCARWRAGPAVYGARVVKDSQKPYLSQNILLRHSV
jgi:hypothetical protein